MAKYTGAKYAVAVATGTAALHLGCLAAGFKMGDEVITSPISFLASSNCVLYSGARPVFADIDPKTLCLNPHEASKYISSSTKGLLVVDMAGHPADIDSFRKLAQKNSLILIEDASHSLGATYKNKHLGSLADMTIFSFHPVKSITTAEGGMITTNNKSFYQRLLSLRNHGVVRDPHQFVNKADPGKEMGPWYYEMQHLGFNYRITEIQCAIGLAQLKKLKMFIEKRREIARLYEKAFKNIPWIKLPEEGKNVRSSWHLYPVQIDFASLRMSRSEVFNRFQKAGIGLQVHYIPIYKQPYYRQLGYADKSCPQAEIYYQQAVSLPLYPKMSLKDFRRVTAAMASLGG